MFKKLVIFSVIFFIVTLTIIGCKSSDGEIDSIDRIDIIPRVALMTTRIKSLDDFKKIIDIEYDKGTRDRVILSQEINHVKLTSILEEGLDQTDFVSAKVGTIWDKIRLGLKSPFTVANREEMLKAYMLARWKFEVFGEGDVALFDLADHMARNISKYDKEKSTDRDLGEKGYLNTFNHFIAQAMYTAIYSEKMADLIADIHERDRLPELITGDFTKEQIMDLDNGAVDNYVDMINNEWGQEYGKLLKIKYGISINTKWSEELLANFLNDIQDYFTGALGIGFIPFRSSDEVIGRFVERTNFIMDDVSTFKKDIWFLRRP